jgi:hypothetical protein
VRSRDSFGNLAVSGDLTFTTPPAPTIPPVISNIVADPWPAGASIGWNSDLAADTFVEFGVTPAYGQSASDAAFRTAHLVSLPDLAPATTYHFRVRVRDEFGNTSTSDDQTFTTPAVGHLPPGAAGFWTFDDAGDTEVTDATGNGNVGTRSGGTGLVSSRDPSRGDALYFDGYDGRVHVSRNPALEPAAVTVSAWVKLVLGTDQAQWVTVIKKAYADDMPPIYDSFSLSISPPGKPNVVSFFTGHAGGSNDQLDAPTPLPTGQWVHIAGTYDPSTGEKRLYVDGAVVASRAMTRPIAYDPTPAGDLYFGEDPGPAEAFRGAIDDAGVWPRALSANEVRTLAYGRAASLATPSDLVATVLSYTRVRLTWTDPTGGAARFLVQRQAEGGAWTDLASVGPGVTSFEDDATPPSQNYRFRVFAQDSLTASGPSAFVTASTKAGGTGLRGEYFDTPDLTGPALTRIDPTVNFEWGSGAPVASVAPGTYSARWTGQVFTFETGQYSFFTTADDGVRLWVNGQLVIDRWSDRPQLAGDANGDGVVDFTDYQIFQRQDRTTNPQSDFNHDGIVNVADFQLLHANLNKTLADTVPTNYATITLQAGVKYDVRLEYFQNAGIACVNLGWITPARARQTIPVDQLFPAVPTPVRPALAPPPAAAPRPAPALRPAAAAPAKRPAATPVPVFSVQPIKKPSPPTARKTVFIPPIVSVKKVVSKPKPHR